MSMDAVQNSGLPSWSYFVPDEGVWVALVGYQSSLAFRPGWQFPRSLIGVDALAQIDIGTSTSSMAHGWNFVPDSSDSSSCRIRWGNNEDSCLFLGSDGLAATAPSKFKHQLFNLRRGTGIYNAMFRIECPAERLVLRSGSSSAFDLSARPIEYDEPDAYFMMVFEELEAVGIDFHLDDGRTSSATPKHIANETVNNDTSEKQSQTVEFNESIQETNSFTGGFGVTIKSETTLQTGIPHIVKGRLKLSAEVNTSFEWGKSNTKTRGYKLSVPVVVPPHKYITVVLSGSEMTLDVPFTMFYVTKRGKKRMGLPGVYRGVNVYDFKTTFKEYNIGEDENQSMRSLEAGEEKDVNINTYVTLAAVQ